MYVKIEDISLPGPWDVRNKDIIVRLSFYSLRVGQTDPNMLLFLSDSSHHQVSDDMTDQIMVHMINQFDQQL